MNRTITLLELRLRSRQRADMERSTKVGDSELDGHINASLGEMHDLIVGNAEDWTLSYQTLALTGSSYSLPDDHWRTRGVDKVEGTDFCPIPRQEFEDRGFFNDYRSIYSSRAGLRWNTEGDVLKFFPSSIVPGAVRLVYVPTSPLLASDSDTIGRPYTINGWDEWIVQDVAAKMLSKEESDPSDCLKRRDDITERIMSAAKRDETGVRQVAFVRTGGDRYWGPRVRS